jgi:O-antigen/teichoic acid export membrane protein
MLNDRAGLTQNMGVSGITAVLGCLVAMISYPVYLNHLGYAQYGVWIVVTTCITLCQIGNLGIGPALITLIAEAIGRNNHQRAQNYTEMAISSVAVLGLLTAILLFMLRTYLERYLNCSTEVIKELDVLWPYVPFLSLYAFLNEVFVAVLIGLGRMDVASAIHASGQVVGFGISVIFLKQGHGVLALASGTLFSLVVVHLLSTISASYFGAIALRPTRHFERKSAKELFNLSYKVFASSVARGLFVPLNKLLLSRYAGIASLPIFEMALTGSMRLRSMFDVSLKLIIPALSHATTFDTTGFNESLRRIKRNSRRVLIVAGFGFACAFLFITPALALWLRRPLPSSFPEAFRLSLVGAYLSLVGVPAYYGLLGLGRTGELFWSHLVQTGMNLAVVGIAVIAGSSISLRTLFIASSTAMATSTVFLLMRYKSQLSRIDYDQAVHMSLTTTPGEITTVAT